MDNDELIDRINNLQAENIALMHMVAALVRHSGINLSNEYAARCSIFRIITEPNMDSDSRAIQREAFRRVGVTVLGNGNAARKE